MKGSSQDDSKQSPPAPASLRVIEAVADREDIDSIDLTPPLAAIVDPGALDELCQSGDFQAEFLYCGYRVTVSRDDITVSEPDET